MNPQDVFCPNLDCAARGQRGQDNIGIHSQKERRYICRVCQKTFSERKGTVLYRLHSPIELVTVVITLLAYGCPLQAIVVAFHLDERTVLNWQARAGQHCEEVHEHLVQQPRELGQVQLDELRVKKQGGIVWLAQRQTKTAGDANRALRALNGLPFDLTANSLCGVAQFET